jgi:hypothetical protein
MDIDKVLRSIGKKLDEQINPSEEFMEKLKKMMEEYRTKD